MNQKHQQNIYHGSVCLSLMVENVIKIKNEIKVNVSICVKIR